VDNKTVKELSEMTTDRPFSIWRSRFKEFGMMWQAFCKDRLALISLFVLMAFALAALFAPWLTPYPMQGKGLPNLNEILSLPNLTHPMGTDDYGRDVLARLLFGSRSSLSIGFLVVGIAMVIGIPLGAVAGYFGGWVDQILMRITDVFLSFPALLLAIAISAALGPSFSNTMIAIGLSWWPWYARLARAQTVSLKNQTFIEASRAIGVRNSIILREHILPNILTPALIQATMDIGSAILMGSALSFVGLGVQPPSPDWGNMLSVARFYFTDQPGFAIYPGLAILLVSLSFNLVGDGVRDVLDPHSRRRG
jgi:peptide/nickel transport system permease protein